MAVDKVVDSEVLDSQLEIIADSIRTKGGTSAPLTFPQGFKAAIDAIPSGGITPSGSISIDENGTYDVTEYAEAVVDVSGGGGGGDITTPWFSVKTTEVVIGANSVNNPQTAVSYFEGIVGENRLMSAFLKTEKESYGTDELVSFAAVGSHTDNSNANRPCAYRYRNNQIVGFSLSSGYSCYLYEGATYVVLYYENRP